MADTVNIQTAFSGTRKHVIVLTNTSDGTGESVVNKLDISTLTGPNAAAPSSVSLLKAEWVCSGMTAALFWDHTANDEMIVCGGTGSVDFTATGGLADPKSTGGTGDVLLTTAGHTAADVYNITLTFLLKE